MERIVLDASAALAWCFKEEATPKSNKLLKKLEITTIIVPSIWHLELSNILIMAERKGRISYANSIQFLKLIDNLNIQTDAFTSNQAFRETFLLAHTEKLTSYDASYLELAIRLKCPLASKDKELIKAAKKLGVEVVDA